MKKEKIDLKTKTFPIKFSLAIVILCIAIYLLCVAGIAVSVWQIARFGIAEFLDVLKYPFLILVSLFAIVLVTCILIRSQYAIEEKTLITQFGFIKSRFDITSVTALELSVSTNKLTVFFGEQFIVITVQASWQEAFIRAMLEANPNIDYSFTLTDTPPAENE